MKKDNSAPKKSRVNKKHNQLEIIEKRGEIYFCDVCFIWYKYTKKKNGKFLKDSVRLQTSPVFQLCLTYFKDIPRLISYNMMNLLIEKGLLTKKEIDSEKCFNFAMKVIKKGKFLGMTNYELKDNGQHELS